MSDIHTLELSPQNEAMRWLLEMEAVMSPTIQSAIILNIKRLDPKIQDVQLLFDTNTKAVLVYLELKRSVLDRWLRRKSETPELVMNQLDQALPSYRKRVVLDRDIFDKALSLAGVTHD